MEPRRRVDHEEFVLDAAEPLPAGGEPKAAPSNELTSRQVVISQILAKRAERRISSYTAADLVHAAREKRTLDE